MQPVVHVPQPHAAAGQSGPQPRAPALAAAGPALTRLCFHSSVAHRVFTARENSARPRSSRRSPQTPLHSMTLELLSCETSAQPAFLRTRLATVPLWRENGQWLTALFRIAIHVAPVASKPVRAAKK